MLCQAGGRWRPLPSAPRPRARRAAGWTLSPLAARVKRETTSCRGHIICPPELASDRSGLSDRRGAGGPMVAARWWLPDGGCPMVADRWWLPGGGCPVVVARWWLPGGGCPMVVARWWWPDGGGPMVVARWWWPDGGGPMVVARWWWPDGGGPDANEERTCRLSRTGCAGVPLRNGSRSVVPYRTEVELGGVSAGADLATAGRPRSTW